MIREYQTPIQTLIYIKISILFLLQPKKTVQDGVYKQLARLTSLQKQVRRNSKLPSAKSRFK